MTEEAVRARELLGMAVYSIAEGRRLGEIRALYVDRAGRAVTAAAVGGSIGQLRHIRFADFTRLGDDIALVQSAAILDRDLPNEEIRALDSELDGRPVITANGQKVGEVIGFTVDCASGKIEAYRIRPEASFLSHLAAAFRSDIVEVSAGSVVSLGADAVIVNDDVAARLGMAPVSAPQDARSA